MSGVWQTKSGRWSNMRILAVCGMHRSGTSCITSELSASKIPMSQSLLAGDAANTIGYFEDPALIALHDDMLYELGSNWMDPAPLRDGWVDHLIGRGFDQELKGYIDSFAECEPCLLVKDPRISRLLILWKHVCDTDGHELHVLHVARDCMDVANSLLRRNNIPYTHSFQIWARYNLDILLQKGDVAYQTIEFEAFLQNPALLSARIADFQLAIPDTSKIGTLADVTKRSHIDTAELDMYLPNYFSYPVMPAKSAFDERAMNDLYEAAGGDALALERRHYSVIHSILWTVVEELRELRGRVEGDST